MNIESRIHLDRFQPRNYQLPLLDAIENKGKKRALAVWPRRSGKDIVCWNLLIRQALRVVGVYFYCLPTFKQARLVIFDSITNNQEKFIDFIPKALIQKINIQEMKIELINGSIISLIGSDSYDTSLVGTNCRMIVFSEWSLSDERAYQFVRPILNANQGVAIFIMCVAPNTLVITESGLKRIKNICNTLDEYTDINENIFGLSGFHKAEQFYKGPKQKTLIITLESGYHIECTPIHPLWNGKEWIKARDILPGDLIPIQYGQNIWGSGLDLSDFHYEYHGHSKKLMFNISDENFFYLLGIIHADGNYNKDIVCVTKKKDPEIIDFVNKRGFVTRKDGIHHQLNSKEFCALLEYMGFKHGARNKEFPEILLKCTKEELRAFIQGVFDCDGTSASGLAKRGYVKLTSTCLSFMQTLQVILLNFGVVSSLRSEDKAPTKKVKVFSRIYNLEITGYFAHVFYRDIGFRLERKQKNWANVPISCQEESGNIYPIDLSQLDDYLLPKSVIENPERISRRIIARLHSINPHPYLQKLLDEKLFFSPIKNITKSENAVFDFVIPETNSFFSNGLISHNTPRGKNHAYSLFQIAQNSEDWFCELLTLHDTGHIPMFEIEKERASGELSEDLIQQEYFCSFSCGVEGSYYSKYLDRMRLKGQIGLVPHETGFKVNSSWDLGYRDSCSIIFYQTCGQVVRIIDYYEKNKEGLEHYVKIINQKADTLGYVYGKHFAPHDIGVNEFGSGMSRIEKALQLGLKFEFRNDNGRRVSVLPNVSIEDGIEAVRSAFSKIWIDETNCKQLINCLENYRQEYDVKRKVYRDQPLHSWASHGADAFRYLVLSLPKTRDGLSSEDLDKRYNDKVYGSNKLTGFFGEDV